MRCVSGGRCSAAGVRYDEEESCCCDEQSDDMGWTPLLWAVSRGQLEVFMFLLSQEVKVCVLCLWHHIRETMGLDWGRRRVLGLCTVDTCV